MGGEKQGMLGGRGRRWGLLSIQQPSSVIGSPGEPGVQALAIKNIALVHYSF